MEVGSALVVAGATFSPLTGGVNANNSSIRPSISMSSYDDATIGDNTMSQGTNDELIQMLDDLDANKTGDSGTSDAEGEGYTCTHSFKNGMKEMELERLCFDANEIESGVKVDDNDAFVCEVTNESVQSRVYGAPPGWSALSAPDDWNPTVNRNKGELLFQDVDNPGGWSLYSFRLMFQPKRGKYICHAMPAGAVPVPIIAVMGKREEGGYECSTKYGSKKTQQERIADLVQPVKIYSLQIEMLN